MTFTELLPAERLVELLKDKTQRQIAQDMGCSQTLIYKLIKRYNLPKVRRRQYKQIKPMLGNRYGSLKVVALIPLSDAGKKEKAKWLCKCDCGGQTVVSGTHLRSDATISCGCAVRRIGKGWKGCGDIGSSLWSSYAWKAKNRDLEFSVSLAYGWQVYLDQAGQCAISGLPINFSVGTKKSRLNRTASLDRINGELGYVIGNIQWVHKSVNIMKGCFDEEYFLQMCRTVAKYRNKPDEHVKTDWYLDANYPANGRSGSRKKFLDNPKVQFDGKPLDRVSGTTSNGSPSRKSNNAKTG